MNKNSKIKQYFIDIIEKIVLYKRKYENPEKSLKKIFLSRMGQELNLDNPKTFNEKLQWIKLYYHDPLYTELVDKLLVKDYISKMIGDKYVIRTLGVWSSFEDIDINKLPNQFVLKCTHDSGGIYICKNKSNIDIKKAKSILSNSLKRNYYYLGFEWPYKNVIPRIIAEEYKEDNITKDLRDYKFFCFNGKVKALFVATDRQNANEEVKFDFFDENYNHLPIKQGHENALIPPEKPSKFEEMKMLAEKLSINIPHVRIDFYEANNQVYFGEMTFFSYSGWTKFEPYEWDYKFGEWLILPPQKII